MMNADGKEHGWSKNWSHTHTHNLIRFPVREGQMASLHWWMLMWPLELVKQGSWQKRSWQENVVGIELLACDVRVQKIYILLRTAGSSFLIRRPQLQQVTEHVCLCWLYMELSCMQFDFLKLSSRTHPEDGVIHFWSVTLWNSSHSVP